MRMKNKTTPDTWFFRYYEDQAGRRVHRNLKIGSVREFPLRKDAEKAVLSLRANINSGIRTPETVHDLVAHYVSKELTADKKSYSTIANFTNNLQQHIIPKWGQCRLSAVRTIAVEEWLHSLPLAPATRSKIRNQMSVIFTHGIRHESFLQTPSARFVVRLLAFGNRMFSPLRSFVLFSAIYPCVSRQWSLWQVQRD